MKHMTAICRSILSISTIVTVLTATILPAAAADLPTKKTLVTGDCQASGRGSREARPRKQVERLHRHRR